MNKKIIHIFVSCPDDVKKEKEIVRDVCHELTLVLGKLKDIEIKVIDWQNDVVPLITGEGAQSVIEKQIEEYDYDIYLGILWKRFGDRQSNGLTPTEEEFEKAFKRREETGRPVIKFYFKQDKYYPENTYEAEQALQVHKFKDKITSLGLYDVFRGKSDFREKAFKSITYIVNSFDSLTSQRIKIPKTKYSEISHYLPRKVCPSQDYSSRHLLFLKSKPSQDIITIVQNHNLIVLLGDAGIGKTTELQRIAWHFSKDDSPLYPYFISLNKYINQSISELLPSQWNKIPEAQLLVILDGLDEIESKNRNDAIRRIELFTDQNPKSHVLVSSRSNFYKSEIEQSSGTLRGFSSYQLLPLNSKEIENFINVILAKQANEFLELILDQDLQHLITIPFYLIHLIELFKANGTLPKGKAKTFERLLISRMQFDVEHFRTTIELEEKQKVIIIALERLGLAMETLGRNYISDDEYQQIISDGSIQTLLKHCTVWKKQKENGVQWQFEHNNFQEYLAARILARQSLDIIKDFFSFKPEYQRIIPSWVNTLSFLISISDNFNLLQWIMDIEPELIVKFEPDRIEPNIRIRNFKEIFNNYKTKQIWIDQDKFRYDELARFGENDNIVDFLLNELENATHYTTLGNAIKLLSVMKIPSSKRQLVTKLFIKCAVNSKNEEIVRGSALSGLAELELNSQDVINQIVPELRSSNSDWIRFGLYNFLHTSNFLDENIDVFLDGIKYVCYRHSKEIQETRLGDEHWHLKLGLEKTKKPHAIQKILNYFKENPKDLDDVFIKESVLIIAQNAANAYSEEPSIFNLVVDLLIVLNNEYLEEEAKQFISFFDKTETRLQAFQKVFEQKNRNSEQFRILAILADDNCIEYFVQQYEKHNVTDDDVWTFQGYLDLKNHKLYLPFRKLINEKSSNKFTIVKKRDYEKERKQRKQSDIDLLFDKSAFLDALKHIFDIEQKQTFTKTELLNLRHYRWDHPYFSDLVFDSLIRIAKGETISLEMAYQIVNSWNWELFCTSKIFDTLENDKEIVLSTVHKDWIENWCYANLNKVDFKTAFITKPNGEFEANRLAIYLWYFLRKLNLRYPDNVLLDMLSFDWFEEHHMLGIKYIEERLSKTYITIRVLENLKEAIKNDYVLKNHIDYCKRHNIKEVLPFALSEITNSARNNILRQAALETVYELSETLSDLEHVLPKTTDDFKWNIVEYLVERNSQYSHEFLLGILENGDEQERFKASNYLIKLQELEGLKYYVNWIKRNKKFPERPFDKSLLLTLKILESVPFLVELLKISYQKDLIQDDFHRLDSIVLDTLTEIALQSEQNYVEIRKAIEKFIDENSSFIENINFLYVYLDRLEQRYYVSKSKELNIHDIIKKVNGLK